MKMLLTYARVEMLRLKRTGLFAGLLAVFAFFGLSGPGLALFMPEILGAATASDQFTIQAADASPADGIAMFNQSSMQLGLILAVAVAITSLGWDSRAGSSIFYRTRVEHLSAITLPRLAVGWGAVAITYTIGFALAVAMTVIFIGEVHTSGITGIWAASIAYLAMAMSIGYLIMAATRRTAAAIASATVVMLVLPILSQFEALSPWAPTTLLAGAETTWMPFLSAAAVTVLCITAGSLIVPTQTLRRDA
ncbi:hypothetical protein [Leucobacter sp. W1478]|uniref:hypothetical protein n=1 Tax=Leucobacter sp. W1478 TaxID=3439065 RepID=UPI003F3AD4B0